MTREEIYSRFEELDKRASLGGGVDKIEKQHAQGKMTARERIGMLLDKGTFNELDKLVNHRCTNFGMEKKQIAGDGMVSGYGKIDGRPVFVYAYDFTAHGGSLSETNAAKIVKVIDTVEPEPELAAKYEEKYRKFAKIYPTVKDLFSEII